MALTEIQMVRVITQDNGRLPFLDEGVYILEDEEIELFLELQDGDVLQAARMASHSIALWMSGINTKEIFGDVEMWNETAKNYLNALKLFQSDTTLISVIPKGLIPYAAGTSVRDLAASLADTDNPNIYNWLYNKSNRGCECEYIQAYTLPTN